VSHAEIGLIVLAVVVASGFILLAAFARVLWDEGVEQTVRIGLLRQGFDKLRSELDDLRPDLDAARKADLDYRRGIAAAVCPEDYEE
jgi:hypothetical protein